MDNGPKKRCMTKWLRLFSGPLSICMRMRGCCPFILVHLRMRRKQNELLKWTTDPKRGVRTSGNMPLKTGMDPIIAWAYAIICVEGGRGSGPRGGYRARGHGG